MEQELSQEEAERRAHEVARRMLTTPPQPRATPKRDKATTTPAPERAAKRGTTGRTGAAS